VKATVPGVAVVNYGEIGDHLQIDVIANVDLTQHSNDTAGRNGRAEPEENHDAYAVQR
jgi:hypothetical protein